MALHIVLSYSAAALGFLILTCYNEKYKKYHFTAKALTSIGFVEIGAMKLSAIAYSYFVTMLLVKCGEAAVNTGLNI